DQQGGFLCAGCLDVSADHADPFDGGIGGDDGDGGGVVAFGGAVADCGYTVEGEVADHAAGELAHQSQAGGGVAAGVRDAGDDVPAALERRGDLVDGGEGVALGEVQVGGEGEVSRFGVARVAGVELGGEEFQIGCRG